MPPRTRYAATPEGHVAYQLLGDGPGEIVFIPDHASNLEIMWEEPSLARFLMRLSSIGRLICFDKRGTGVSDPVPLGALPTLEQWMDDIRTVVDAVGSERVTVFGHGDGGLMAILFAATYPERTSALILADAFARMVRAADYPCGMPPDVARAYYETLCERWGSGTLENPGPSMMSNPSFREWRGRFERLSLSPGALAAMYPVIVLQSDVRFVLETIRVPTLVLHRAGNRYIRVGHGRYLAQQIAGAKYVELAGEDHFFHVGDSEALLAAVQEFLTGKKQVHDDDRVLATVLFTDIVGSTERAAEMGDRAWRDLLEGYYAVIRGELARFRGREVDTAGDGLFATFDGPARGVRCALAIRDSVRQLGLEIRAGLHTGECELIGDKVRGIAVHIGARVAAAARAGEVLTSTTVKDLVAGSGLRFIDRGVHLLRGVSGEWKLFGAA
jgi:pimeloyl-ACP methyl ester carboxylesterase